MGNGKAQFINLLRNVSIGIVICLAFQSQFSDSQTERIAVETMTSTHFIVNGFCSSRHKFDVTKPAQALPRETEMCRAACSIDLPGMEGIVIQN
jgi:hypothetical protein